VEALSEVGGVVKGLSITAADRPWLRSKESFMRISGTGEVLSMIEMEQSRLLVSGNSGEGLKARMKEIAEISMTYGKALCHKLRNKIWYSQYPNNLVQSISK
jgi:hypothetical protein